MVLWASGFIGAKYGLPYAEPLTFLAIRMGAAVALLAVIAVLTRAPWSGGTGILHGVVAGLLVHGCYLGGVFVSIDHHLPTGLAAMVVGLQPVLTSTLANRLLGERVTPRQWCGLALGLVGIYLIVESRTAGDAPFIAWAAAAVALVGITLGTLYQKRFGGAIDWRTGMLVQYAAACLLFTVGAWSFETRAVQWTGEFVLAVGWLVIGLSLGAVWLLYDFIRRSAATRVVSLFYLTPPMTALMAYALFGETLTPVAIGGMAICVAGVALVNLRMGRA